jgi:hypothetical protein
MKKLTTLLSALVAFGLMAGTAVAADTMGKALNDQISNNDFGHVADGVTEDATRGSFVVWEGRTDETIAMSEDLLRKQLSPYVSGYIADGVGEKGFKGVIDIHYGVAPAWENRTEEPRALEDFLY